MISRLTALAAVFSICAAASITYAASVQHTAPIVASASAKPVRIVQLERVVVTAKRLPQAAI